MPCRAVVGCVGFAVRVLHQARDCVLASPFPPGPVSAQALLSGVGRWKAGRRLGSTDPGVCCIVASGRWGDSWRQPRGGFLRLCHLNRRGFHRPLSTKGTAQPSCRLPPAHSWGVSPPPACAALISSAEAGPPGLYWDTHRTVLFSVNRAGLHTPWVAPHLRI